MTIIMQNIHPVPIGRNLLQQGTNHQNLPGKLGQQSANCWNSLDLFRDYVLNHFLFFKIENRNFQHLFENKFCETSQYFNSFSLFRQFLFLLSDWFEFLWGSFSNRFWKFQLSILKNKKVPKKISFKPFSLSKQESFVKWRNFLEGFGLDNQNKNKTKNWLPDISCIFSDTNF